MEKKTVGTVPKSNRKNVETGNNNTTKAHTVRSLSWLSTDTSRKSGRSRFKLVLEAQLSRHCEMIRSRQCFPYDK